MHSLTFIIINGTYCLQVNMLLASYLIDEYKCGCTPNPDVLCNTRFKFGAFMDTISNMDFEFVASGHYAKFIHPLADETNELSFLQLSKDMVRHGPLFYDCSLHIEEKYAIGTVQLPEDDHGLADGQFAAFYQQELCVGSGVILESWYDAKGFPVSVSDKCRHIAKMEDKSKLERKQEQLKNEINLEEKIFNLSNRIDQLLCIISSLCTAHQVLEQWAKSGGISYNDYVELCAKKEAVSELGKEAKLDMFELPAKIKLLPDPWTPESGLVTAALKLKRDQMKAKFMDDLQKLYE
ncbi:unnamed protein product [Lactuca virosa]|uniref:Uncharacterized protein n=1 Tax=Lactuca virosa TaxID=75947 RepID=A0AAU9PX63_9ASTR|nr:unnamed protein product [Lactuca virosa]